MNYDNKQPEKSQDNLVRNSSQPISRRSFVGGAAAFGAASALGATALVSGCSSAADPNAPAGSVPAEPITVETTEDSDGGIKTLSVPTSSIIESSSFAETELSSYLEQEYEFDLPIGTQLIWCNTASALALIPGSLVDGGALITLASVSLATGEHTQLLNAALGHQEGFVIFNAAASDEALAWVECNLATNSWRLFVAPLNKGKVGSGQLVEEGEALYEPPVPVVSGTKVYWQHMPDANGSASTEESTLRSVQAFEQDAAAAVQTVLTSNGRFATAPHIAADVLCVAPRANAAGIYYQLTALDVKTDTVVAHEVLPQSMRIINATYAGGSFSFATTSNYDYAQGLALFGSYVDLGGGSWLHINRSPAFNIVRFGVGNNSLIIFKSAQSIVGLDVAKAKYVVLDPLDNSADYGDILVGAGTEQGLLTYTTVFDKATNLEDATKLGVSGKVTVRTWRSK